MPSIASSVLMLTVLLIYFESWLCLNKINDEVVKAYRRSYLALGQNWQGVREILHNRRSHITQHRPTSPNSLVTYRLSILLKRGTQLNKQLNCHSLGKCCCWLFSWVSLYGAITAHRVRDCEGSPHLSIAEVISLADASPPWSIRIRKYSCAANRTCRDFTTNVIRNYHNATVWWRQEKMVL